MNFLSHYYIDRQTQSPEYAAGLILPDLLRGQPAKPTIRWTAPLPELAPEGVRAMHQGVLKHHALDKVFHQSMFFRSYARAIEISMAATEMNRQPRSFFLKHILVEMSIDRVVISEEPAMASEFYRLLAACPESALQQYCQSIGAQPQPLLMSFRQFLEEKFLYKYLDPNQLAAAVVKVYERVVGEKFRFSPQSLKEVLLFAEESIEPGWRQMMRILAEKSNKLVA